MYRKVIVFVTAGKWQMPGIIKAKSLGYYTIAVDGNPEAEGLKFADQGIVVDINKPDIVIMKLNELGKDLSGVISYCSEAGMHTAAKIRDYYKLPGPTDFLSKVITTKKLQREIWKKESIEDLFWDVVKEGENDRINRIVDNNVLPLIVKPVDGSGSRGVHKVESLNNLKSLIEDSLSFSKAKEVMVEKYIQGIEYAVETFTVNGKTHILAISEKGKVFGSNGLVSQELFKPDDIGKVENIISLKVVQAIKALNFNDGPGHTELIVDENNCAHLIEFAGRGGGYGVFDKLIPLASGIDVSKLALMQSVGDCLSLEELNIQKNFYSLKFFPIFKDGVVRSIDGVSASNLLDGCEVGSFVRVGDKVNKSFTDGSRLGFMLIKGNNRHQVLERIFKVEKLVSFTIED